MRPVFALLGLAALVGACGGSHDSQEPRAAEAAGAGIPVQAQEIAQRVAVEGTIFARNRAEITTRMMARVTSVDADVGARVRRGQILIQLGTEDIAANRAKAEAAVRAAEAARDEASRHVARMDTLLAQDVVPQVQRDQARLQLTQAESQLALA